MLELPFTSNFTGQDNSKLYLFSENFLGNKLLDKLDNKLEHSIKKEFDPDKLGEYIKHIFDDTKIVKHGHWNLLIDQWIFYYAPTILDSINDQSLSTKIKICEAFHETIDEIVDICTQPYDEPCPTVWKIKT